MITSKKNKHDKEGSVQQVSNLLALDQSSKVSGYAVFRDNSLLAHGVIELKDRNLGIRLKKLRDIVSELIDKYEIDRILIEDIQHQKNVTGSVVTFKVLAEVIGVLEELFTEKKIQYFLVPSVTWRSDLKFKSKVRKDQKAEAQSYVLTHYGIEATEDECDAICIGAYGLS